MALSAFSSKCQILSNLTVLRKIVPIDVWPNRCLIWHNAIFICMRHVTQIGNQQRYQMIQTNLFQWHFLGNEPHSSAKVQSIGTILRCTLLCQYQASSPMNTSYKDSSSILASIMFFYSLYHRGCIISLPNQIVDLCISFIVYIDI